tara:strand:+ start:952 stop:1857 length:906 start_codon:yes stop_codon:yes gene_type:complete
MRAMNPQTRQRIFSQIPLWLWPYVWLQLWGLQRWIRASGRSLLIAVCPRTGHVYITAMADAPCLFVRVSCILRAHCVLVAGPTCTPPAFDTSQALSPHPTHTFPAARPQGQRPPVLAPRHLKSRTCWCLWLDPPPGAPRHPFMTESEITPADQRILDDIARHGWHSCHVFDPELATPNFTYTVGFTQTLDAPEFIVFGLHRDEMHAMLSEVFRQIKAGRKVDGGQAWQGLSPDFDCIGKKAADEALFTLYMPVADGFWKHQGHRGHPAVVQLVWPGWLDGLYPWDEGCAANVIAAQPKLWS